MVLCLFDYSDRSLWLNHNILELAARSIHAIQPLQSIYSPWYTLLHLWNHFHSRYGQCLLRVWSNGPTLTPSDPIHIQTRLRRTHHYTTYIHLGASSWSSRNRYMYSCFGRRRLDPCHYYLHPSSFQWTLHGLVICTVWYMVALHFSHSLEFKNP